jgi:DNA mismatch repair protein MSH6
MHQSARITSSVTSATWTRRAPTPELLARGTGTVHSSRSTVSLLILLTPPQSSIMVRGVEGNEMSTPRPSQKKQPPSASQSGKGQKSILGFFQKKSTNSPSPVPSTPTTAKNTPIAIRQTPISTLSKTAFTRPPVSITPVPSSDAPIPSSPIREGSESTVGRNKENGQSLPLPVDMAEANHILSEVAGVAFSSPSRKV